MLRASLLALALSTAAIAANPVSAQIAQPEVAVAPNSTILSVNGEGHSTREPDLAVFSAGVTTKGSDAAKALAENSRAMERVIAALRRAGIAERDIQTSNLSITPVYRDPAREEAMRARMTGQPSPPPSPESQIPTIIGYQANNTVSVRQRKLSGYGAVIDALASAGANQINGPDFQMDDPQPALDDARRDAMADARRKAELLAKGAGLRIVRIISIAEGGGYFGPSPQVRFRAQGAVAAPPPPVQPGEMQMTAGVSVMYELAP